MFFVSKKFCKACKILSEVLEIDKVYNPQNVLNFDNIDPSVMGFVIKYIEEGEAMRWLPFINIEVLVKVIKCCDYMKCAELLQVCSQELNRRINNTNSLKDLVYVSSLF